MYKKILFFLGFFSLVASLVVLSSRFGYTQPSNLSPYVTQLDSPIRGLSNLEVQDLVNGRGAGYARMAELNGYPGPSHILDLDRELKLSSNQIFQIESVFKRMQADAKGVGQQIVSHEKQLSAAFASGKINETQMQASTEELGKLYSQLRAIHLMAHLQIKPLLKPEQIDNYNKLRGYSNTSEQSKPIHQQRHH
jgi:Spy/CpxP family protein refolding chaperone